MIKKIVFFLAAQLFPLVANAETKSVVQQMRDTIKGAKLDLKGLETEPEVALGYMLPVVLSFLGLIFFILIIYGGLLWMTAGGNEEQVKKARGIIISSGIGLFIIIASYIITVVVIQILQESIVASP